MNSFSIKTDKFVTRENKNVIKGETDWSMFALSKERSELSMRGVYDRRSASKLRGSVSPTWRADASHRGSISITKRITWTNSKSLEWTNRTNFEVWTVQCNTLSSVLFVDRARTGLPDESVSSRVERHDMSSSTWVANKDLVELELRTYLNLWTYNLFEMLKYHERNNLEISKQWQLLHLNLGKSRKPKTIGQNQLVKI